jgi:hypothetical protein
MIIAAIVVAKAHIPNSAKITPNAARVDELQPSS